MCAMEFIMDLLACPSADRLDLAGAQSDHLFYPLILAVLMVELAV